MKSNWILLYVFIFSLGSTISQGQKSLDGFDFDQFKSKVITDNVPLKIQGLKVINFDYVEFDTSLILHFDTLNVLEIVAIITDDFQGDSGLEIKYKKMDNPIELKLKSSIDSSILFDYGFRLNIGEEVYYSLRLVSLDSVPFYVYNLVYNKTNESWKINNLVEHEIFFKVLKYFSHQGFSSLYDKDIVGSNQYENFKQKCFTNNHFNFSLFNLELNKMDEKFIIKIAEEFN